MSPGNSRPFYMSALEGLRMHSIRPTFGNHMLMVSVAQLRGQGGVDQKTDHWWVDWRVWCLGAVRCEDAVPHQSLHTRKSTWQSLLSRHAWVPHFA